MTFKKRFFKISRLLFALLCLTQLIPNKIDKPDEFLYTLGFAAIIEIALIAADAFSRKPETLNLPHDIAAFLYALLIVWILATAKLSLLKEMLFPPPGVVFKQLITDIPQLLPHIGSSLALVGKGYALALAIAVPLGLILGTAVRAGNAATYISKFIGSIPPVVYIPYGIALLPSFRAVSVMVIFLASFWPILAATMSGVLYIDKRITDSAQVLNVGKTETLCKIILPASLPQIFTGMGQGLTVSFILLTSAEMIGARNGMGYYVKNYSDLGNYTRTIVGVLIIGIVISVVFFVFNKLQKFALRWR
ncbi:MAG: ABC transporter permease subunit [Oscillospiraceae bacterium]|jgi:NitT/TauT family transport system permease protein|nr:ABC transporter permease subunit [Oscillospiraceae bacterium]